MSTSPYELDAGGESAGRYTLHAQLAAGGMGTVHLGRRIGAGGFERIVAIKRLHPQFAAESEFTSLLVDEASVAGSIQHPNVVGTLDVVRQAGELLLVMDYVEGETLTRLLKYSRRARTLQSPPMPVLVAVMVDTLSGLHAAHTARTAAGVPLQIVHRDVSPHNVLVGVDGRARVHDFGIAKAERRSQTTRPGQIKGKFAYLSPEQIRGLPVDARTDVFAAGIMLWEGLAQRRLFLMERPQDTIKNILENGVLPPSVYDASISTRLDRIALKALSPRMEDRFPSAEEFADELAAAVAPAKRSEVGAWVRATAERRLAERARLVARVTSERHPPVSERTKPEPCATPAVALPSFENLPRPSSVPPPSVTTLNPSSALPVTWTARSIGPERAGFRFSRFMPLAAALIGIGVCALALAVAGRASDDANAFRAANLSDLQAKGAPRPASRPGATSHVSLPSAVPSAPRVVVLAALADEGERAPRDGESGESAAKARAERARPAPPANRRPKTVRAAPRSAALASHAANRSCETPYVVDAAGVRRVRKECL